MEIIKTVKEGDMQIENHIKVENGFYTHRQIERIGDRVFMRIKQRKLADVTER